MNEWVWIIVFIIIIFLVVAALVWWNSSSTTGFVGSNGVVVGNNGTVVGATTSSAIWWIVGIFVFLIIIGLLIYAVWPRTSVVMREPPVTHTVVATGAPPPATPTNTNVFVSQPDNQAPPPTLAGSPSVVHNHFYGAEQLPPQIPGPLPPPPIIPETQPDGTMSQASVPLGQATFNEHAFKQYMLQSGQRYEALGPNGIPGTVQTPATLHVASINRGPIPISVARGLGPLPPGYQWTRTGTSAF